MSTNWQVLVDWDRDGAYSDVTEWVITADWLIGMAEPYQTASDNSRLDLTLDNSDRRFSPEYEVSPLIGQVVPFRPVQVTADDGITERVMWRGWIESIEPDVNQNGDRRVRIVASGAMQFFKGTETSIAIQENERTDTIISRLLEQVLIPAPLNRMTIIDSAVYAAIDTTAWVSGSADINVASVLDTGLITLAYAADNWVQRSFGDERSFNVYRAIADVTAAERGRFLFDREGKALFWNRYRLLGNQTLKATFDNDMTGLRYSFAGVGEFKNKITVTCHPRTISNNPNDLLWVLEEPLLVRANSTRTIGASFRDDSENRIGGKDVYLDNVTFSEGSARIVLHESANRGTIELTNVNAEDAVLATCEIRGQKITDFGRIEVTRQDGESIALYGERALSMNLSSIDDIDQAEVIAQYELQRRKTPTGKVSAVTLLSHGKNGGLQHDKQLELTLGDRIRILEDQTAHDNQYFIIGESHRLSDGATRYETTWYLESATETNFVIIDDGRIAIDVDRYIVP